MPRQCRRGWLETYQDYTLNQESPDLFHKWVGISTIGTAIGRRVWINRGYYCLYPNFYIILVGESARLRKSVATSIGTGFLRKVAKPPVIFAQKLTQESLIQTLSQLSSKQLPAEALAYAPELSTFLGSFQQNGGLVSTLTTLYDCPDTWVYRTVMRGEEVLKYVCLNMLGASTSDWMRLSIPEDAVGGGFTSRIVFVCPQGATRIIAFPELTPELLRLQNQLIQDLDHIIELRGEVQLTEEAKLWFEQWYLSFDTNEGSPMLRGYRGRKHDLLLKLAMIRSISQVDDLVITEEHLEWALDELDNVEVGMARELEDLHLSQFGKEARFVLELVRKKHEVKHTELLRNCWRFTDAEGLEKIVRTLEGAKLISETIGERNVRYYRAL